MTLERPPSLHDGCVERDTNSSSDAMASIPNFPAHKRNQKHRHRQTQTQRQKVKRKKTSNRYFLVLGLCSMFYICMVYYSLQFAGQSLMQLDAPQPSRRKSNRKSKKSNNDGSLSGMIFDQVEKAFSAPKQTRKRVATRQVRHPSLPRKFEAPELKLPKPIINVGFPKAGTSTIFSFFHCNGLKAQHWYCCEEQKHPGNTKSFKLMSSCMLRNMAANRSIFENCGDYDVYTEINGPRQFKETNSSIMLDDGTLLPRSESTPRKNRIFFPQHHQLDKIHQQFPNATLILNNRDTDAWVDSVIAWDPNLQYQLLNEFYGQNMTRFLFLNTTNETAHAEGIDRLVHENNTTVSNATESRMRARRKNKDGPFSSSVKRRTLLQTVYHYHQQYIQDWVANHPSHALVEVNIADEDAGKILATSFGLQEGCWGHFNKKKPKAGPKVSGKQMPPKPKKPLKVSKQVPPHIARMRDAHTEKSVPISVTRLQENNSIEDHTIKRDVVENLQESQPAENRTVEIDSAQKLPENNSTENRTIEMDVVQKTQEDNSTDNRTVDVKVKTNRGDH